MSGNAGQQVKTHRIKSKSRLIGKEVGLDMMKPNKQLQTIEVGRPKAKGPGRDDSDSGSDGSRERHDDETVLILDEVALMNK